MSVTTIRAYLDTNTLLEFRDFTELDWPTILNEREVVLVIAHTVISELQEIKDRAGFPRRKRERAGRLLRTLEGLVFPDPSTPNQPHHVRPGVRVEYDRTPSSEELFKAHHLDRQTGDGRLVAAVIAATEAGHRACIVTNDFGARFIAKGAGVTAFDMPEEHRLPDEPDATELENRELKRKVAALGMRIPKLSLKLGTSAAFITRTLHAPREPVEEHTERHAEALRLMHAEDSIFLKMNRTPALAMPVSPSEIARHEKEMKQFLSEAPAFIRARIEHRNLVDLYLEFSDLEVVNDGSAPADNIEFVVRVPSGLSIRSRLPKRPPPLPDPPAAPQSLFEFSSALPMKFMAHNLVVSRAWRRDERPVLRTSKDKTQGRVRLGGIRHGAEPLVIPKFYIRLESFERAKSFSFEYEIHCDNLPTPVRGDVGVRLEKTDRLSPLRLEKKPKGDDSGEDDPDE